MPGKEFARTETDRRKIPSEIINKIEKMKLQGKLKLAELALAGLIKEYPDISELYDMDADIKYEVDNKDKKYQVSAIVSCYNSERFIKGRLENLVNQTIFIKKQLEIIVIDSNSPQNEKKIVEEFIKNYKHIRYIRTAARETVYGAWNRGIKLAKGRYVINANTDDRFTPDGLEILAKELDGDKDISGVYGDWMVTRVENDTFDSDTRKFIFTYHEFFPPLFLYYQITSHAVLLRRDVFEKIGFYNDELKVFGDRDFMFRFVKYGLKAKKIHRIVGLYLESPGSLEHAERLSKIEFEPLRKEYSLPENISRLFNFTGVPENDLLARMYAISGSMGYGYYIWNEVPGSDLNFSAELFNKALALDGKNFLALNNLAIIYCLCKRYKEAIELFQKAHPVNPSILNKNISMAKKGSYDIKDYHWIKPEISCDINKVFHTSCYKRSTENSKKQPVKSISHTRLVSVIVSCYNYGQYLGEAIESVIRQTYQHIEIIIINDGSTDNTKEIALKLINTYPEYSIHLVDRPNSGIVKARNTGISAAKGDYILPLDADDSIAPEMLEKCVNILNAYPDIAIAYTDVQEFGSLHRMVPSIEYNFDILCHMNYITCTALFRREAWQSVGGYSMTMKDGYEDWDFWIACGEKGFYGKRIGEPLFYYRKKPESRNMDAINQEKFLKAQIVLNHFKLYSPCQVAWAKGIMAYDHSVLSIPDRLYFIPQFPEPLPDNIKSILEKYNKKTRTLITMYGWNETGGGTTFPKAFAKKLVKMGMDVAVFYATATHPLHTEPYYLEYRIEEDVHLYGVYNRPAVFLDIENPEREIYDPECVKLFAGILDDFKPDLVHFHNFLGLSFAIAKEAKQRDLLTLFTPYNYHLIDPTLYLFRSDLSLWSDTDFFSNSELPVKYPSLALSYRERINASRELLNKYIDYTLAVSRRVRELLVLFGGEPDRIAVVNQVHETIEPLLINDGEYSLHKPLRFGFIGGVMPHKGVHVIVAAAQNLPAGSAEFWIYGFISEGYSNVLMSMDQKKIIKLKGPYNSSDLPDMAKELDAMILPSLWEDCAPFTITESLAMKLPVIGSNIGGFPDFIRDGVNGRLYTYNSHQELSRILREIIDNPELLIKWRENCFIHLRFEDHVNHVMDIYRTLLNGKRPPAETLSFYFLPHEKKLPTLQKREDTVTDSLNRLAFSADLAGGFSNKRAAGKMPSPFPSPLYLNLGCGKDIRDGFVNIDLFSDDRRVVGMDVRKLDLPDNCADGILASDILEHFSHRETGMILREWARVLKPGGELVVRCPSLYLQIKAYWNGIWDADVASYMIFGGQTNPGDYHCTGFDEKSMRKYLTSAGLEVTSFEEIDTPQDKGFINLNMTVRARKTASSITGMSGISLTKPVIYWEGSQFVYHSLALINRELCLQLIDRGFDVTIIPYENHQFKESVDIRFNKISKRLTTTMSRPADIHVRHQWPPKFTAPPAGGHWVIIQPWEYGRLRKEWVEPMRDLIDEIWIPSNFVRKSYIESGIQPGKVFVIPNGFNPEIFNTSVAPFPVKTDKKFKFLFVGGTIWRKGADVLVNAYIKTFTASDDVSLIIKDIGHDTFYRGMGLGEQLKKIQENPSMPEIIYIKDFLSEKEMAGLYTACDCLLHPYRGEGFAFPVLEAMACGKPVIVTKGGATDDFCKEEFTFHVSAEWKNITFPDMELVGNEGMVLEPSMDSLVKNMRYVYENYPSALEKAARAMEFVKSRYTWDKIGDALVERINKLRNKPVLRYEKIKILMKRGENFFTEGNIDEAMKCFSSIIDIEPSSGKAHSHMATLYWKRNDRVKALTHIKEAIKFSPYDADVVWNYGNIMTERGYKSDAFKAYKEYLSKNPHDGEIKSLFDKLLKEEEIRKPSSHENKKKDKKKKKK